MSRELFRSCARVSSGLALVVAWLCRPRKSARAFWPPAYAHPGTRHPFFAPQPGRQCARILPLEAACIGNRRLKMPLTPRFVLPAPHAQALSRHDVRHPSCCFHRPHTLALPCSASPPSPRPPRSPLSLQAKALLDLLRGHSLSHSQSFGAATSYSQTFEKAPSFTSELRERVGFTGELRR